MIQFEGVKKAFGGQLLFEDVSFFLGKGEKMGLVGRNGSGKSTLFRMIVGQEEIDGGAISLPKDYTIGYLDQHITFTQETILEEGALGLPPNEKDHLYKIEAILFGLGFGPEDMYRHPGELSGGYHLRLHLAKVLVSEPDCLLLDEPTNYLDIVSISWLEKFLRSWSREFLLITHDREFMDSVTTHTIGLHRHRIRKVKGDTEEYFSKILMEEQIHERTRQKLDQKRAKLQNYIDRFGAKASKASQAQSKRKAMDKMPALGQLALIDDLDFEFQYSSFPGKQMLQVEGVEFGYEPENPLIRNVTFGLEKNDCVAVVGKNGRGKSTLLKLLTGELEPGQGSVRVSPNLKVGYFGQTNIDRLHPQHTIEEEVSLANPKLSISQSRSICGAMLFDGDKAKKTISVLSGGERSRVLLGKMIATPCNILFLDEPTHHLDMESIETLISAIDAFPGAVVIVTHSEMILEKLPLTQMIVCRKDGQQWIQGDYQDFLDRGGWEEETGKKKGKQKRDKKSRAESVQERSKVLKPLQREISAREKKIMELENEMSSWNHLLLDASQNGETEKIVALTRSISVAEKEIESAFAELEALAKQVSQKESELGLE